MANTFTQLRVQIVFAVLGRENMVKETHRLEVEKYITGVIQKRNHKMLAIYCMPDHLHMFIGLHPGQSISKLVEEVKRTSQKFINSQKWMAFKFQWQRGYGAFSYSKSHTDSVVKYILNQPEHHKKKTFKEEYQEMLHKLDIKYNQEYLFEFYD